MTNSQRLVLVLAFILAVLLGILLATTLLGGKGGSPAPSPGPSASVGATAPPSGAASSTPAPASPSAGGSASPVPTPTPRPVAAATVSFLQLALDASTDAGGRARSINFTGETGPVTVTFTTESGGNSSICLYRDSVQVVCRTGTSGTLASAADRQAAYRVALRGAGSARPVLTVTITFPATKPKVAITNARFDGTDSPATNGLQVVATPRAKGTYQVAASWGGHPFLYEIVLIEQGGPGLKQVQAAMGATKATQAFAVAPPHGWMIVLRNSEGGFGVTPLSATFTWP